MAIASDDLGMTLNMPGDITALGLGMVSPALPLSRSPAQGGGR